MGPAELRTFSVPAFLNKPTGSLWRDVWPILTMVACLPTIALFCRRRRLADACLYSFGFLVAVIYHALHLSAVESGLEETSFLGLTGAGWRTIDIIAANLCLARTMGHALGVDHPLIAMVPNILLPIVIVVALCTFPRVGMPLVARITCSMMAVTLVLQLVAEGQAMVRHLATRYTWAGMLRTVTSVSAGLFSFYMPSIHADSYWFWHSLWHVFMGIGYFELYAQLEGVRLSKHGILGIEEADRFTKELSSPTSTAGPVTSCQHASVSAVARAWPQGVEGTLDVSHPFQCAHKSKQQNELAMISPQGEGPVGGVSVTERGDEIPVDGVAVVTGRKGGLLEVRRSSRIRSSSSATTSATQNGHSAMAKIVSRTPTPSAPSTALTGKGAPAGNEGYEHSNGMRRRGRKHAEETHEGVLGEDDQPGEQVALLGKGKGGRGCGQEESWNQEKELNSEGGHYPGYHQVGDGAWYSLISSQLSQFKTVLGLLRWLGWSSAKQGSDAGEGRAGDLQEEQVLVQGRPEMGATGGGEWGDSFAEARQAVLQAKDAVQSLRGLDNSEVHDKPQVQEGRKKGVKGASEGIGHGEKSGKSGKARSQSRGRTPTKGRPKNLLSATQPLSPQGDWMVADSGHTSHTSPNAAAARGAKGRSRSRGRGVGALDS